MATDRLAHDLLRTAVIGSGFVAPHHVDAGPGARAVRFVEAVLESARAECRVVL
jgi:hypothetical protein